MERNDPGRLERPPGIIDAVLFDGVWVDAPRLTRQFSSDTTWILSRIEQIFRGFGSARQAPAFRVFVENGERTDLAVKLRRSPMLETEGFDQWAPRVIGTDEYCLAFNGVTAWDEPLAAYVSEEFVRPIVRVAGLPTRGFDVYLFAGRYQMTPFGIHRDREPSILLHLGPAPKQAHIWASRTYPRPLAPNQELNEFDLAAADLRSSAESLILRTGDLLFIPAWDPHIMQSHEFSVTLGIIPNAVDEQSAIVECVRELGDLQGGFTSDASFFHDPGRLACRAEDLLGTPGERAERLDTAARSIELRLSSNGYLVPAPVERTCAFPALVHRFRVADIYPTIVSRQGDGIVVYARGRFVRMRFDPLLFSWLSENLLQGKVIDRGETDRVLGERLEIGAISSILDALFRIQAICPLQPSE
jgi:hypothetical protein